MTRTEVKRKLDKILQTFHPNGTKYEIEDEDYELLINTVWQFSNSLNEEELIRKKEYIKMLQSFESRDIFMSEILRRILNEFRLFHHYLE